jgi:hypothetical protein
VIKTDNLLVALCASQLAAALWCKSVLGPAVSECAAADQEGVASAAYLAWLLFLDTFCLDFMRYFADATVIKEGVEIVLVRLHLRLRVLLLFLGHWITEWIVLIPL